MAIPAYLLWKYFVEDEKVEDNTGISAEAQQNEDTLASAKWGPYRFKLNKLLFLVQRRKAGTCSDVSWQLEGSELFKGQPGRLCDLIVFDDDQLRLLERKHGLEEGTVREFASRYCYQKAALPHDDPIPDNVKNDPGGLGAGVTGGLQKTEINGNPGHPGDPTFWEHIRSEPVRAALVGGAGALSCGVIGGKLAHALGLPDSAIGAAVGVTALGGAYGFLMFEYAGHLYLSHSSLFEHLGAEPGLAFAVGGVGALAGVATVVIGGTYSGIWSVLPGPVKGVASLAGGAAGAFTALQLEYMAHTTVDKVQGVSILGWHPFA